MKRFWIIGIVFCMLSSKAQASNDTIIIKNDRSHEIIEQSLDSLVTQWYLSKLMEERDYGDNSLSPVVEFSDSIYRMRLEAIQSVIDLPYNSIVRNHIHVYTGKKRKNFEVMLGMREYYFPMIEDIFDSYGLPAELKYMAVIESALNPNAVSRVGATGMWQFMYSTGRQYGLTINSVVDDRRDPVKATHAAARYIKDLYRVYKDWGLVIAAYNCGPGNVNKAIRRSGNRKDYWEIYYRLPRETRGYLPGYIAATYAMTYHKEHNIVPKHVTFPVVTDTIMLTQDIHLRQIAEVLSVSYAELRTLNPQYKASLIPGSSKPMPLTLPLNNVGDFISLEDSIASHRADHYLKPQTKTASPTRSTYTPPDIKGKTKLIYIVKEGDNLGYIASWYNVGLSNLRYWNNIYRNTIRIGQKISVFVDPSKKDYYTAVNKLSFEEKQKRIGKSVPVNTSTTSTTANFGGKFVYHTVRSGDTVWDIAKEYDGVSVSEILSINGMSGSGKIAVGQRLKIKRKS
jgi:membrane-bound lytic murein transglycosylase D